MPIIDNIMNEFNPEIGDIKGLQTELNSIKDAGVKSHTHNTSDITGLDDLLSNSGSSGLSIGDVQLSTNTDLGAKFLPCNGEIIDFVKYPDLMYTKTNNKYTYSFKDKGDYSDDNNGGRCTNVVKIGDYFVAYDTYTDSSYPYGELHAYHIPSRSLTNTKMTQTGESSSVSNIIAVGNTALYISSNYGNNYYLYASPSPFTTATSISTIGANPNIEDDLVAKRIFYVNGKIHMFLGNSYSYATYTEGATSVSFSTAITLPEIAVDVCYDNGYFYITTEGGNILKAATISASASAYTKITPSVAPKKICVANGYMVYTSSGLLYVSKDNGTSWKTIDLAIPSESDSKFVLIANVSYNNGFFVCCSNRGFFAYATNPYDAWYDSMNCYDQYINECIDIGNTKGTISHDDFDNEYMSLSLSDAIIYDNLIFGVGCGNYYSDTSRYGTCNVFLNGTRHYPLIEIPGVTAFMKIAD